MSVFSIFALFCDFFGKLEIKKLFIFLLNAKKNLRRSLQVKTEQKGIKCIKKKACKRPLQDLDVAPHRGQQLHMLTSHSSAAK